MGKKSESLRWARRWPIRLTSIRRFLEPPEQLIEPYVKNGFVVADLGCGSGYYTFVLARYVGPTGKIYAVDKDEKVIRIIEKKMKQDGYHTIETHVSSASDLHFIKDESVDFILANGLLCSMADQRTEAVQEMKRILKREGKAYLSLGAPPPLGFVGKAEWEKILQGFVVDQQGVRWALVRMLRET